MRVCEGYIAPVLLRTSLSQSFADMSARTVDDMYVRHHAPLWRSFGSMYTAGVRKGRVFVSTVTQGDGGYSEPDPLTCRASMVQRI